ncbi:WIYLD domain-containing protein [Salix suchowensis]|nr:WIYLD domain-containing protein [Salix suchowensis]
MHPHGPRSTGRRRKRLTRMDAAVDAMRSYGFSDGLIVSTVKGLLKVYGEEGWPFIEESSYKVLLEAILEDLEKEEQEKSNKLQENERCGNNIEISAGSTSNGVSVSTGHSTEAVAPASQPDETLLTVSQAANLDIALLDGTPASKAGSSWTDINMDENCIEKQTNSDNRGGVMNFGGAQLPGNISSPTQPTHCAPPCRRRPCYGWISSDEDDDVDVIELAPAPLPAVVAKLLSGIDAPRTRKRRWDVRPEDM